MEKTSQARKLLWLVPLVILLLAIPLPIVTKLEERDSFCISCHTAPEEAYYNRAQQALAIKDAGSFEDPADLASAHYGLAEEPFRCIDCHRGDGSILHRGETLLLGTRDALILLSGSADETLEKTAAAAPDLLNAGCTHCHTESLLVTGFNNHFHNMLPPAYEAWQAGGTLFPPQGFSEIPEGAEPELFETALTCLDCHHAHKSITDGSFTLYLDVEAVVFPACVQCHAETGHGPLELDS